MSKQFPDDYIIMIGDNASWHKSKGLVIPNNMELLHIPPYTPEMNPTEQVWDEVREKDFKNRFFNTLESVTNQLCKSFGGISTDLIKSLCGRAWINAVF